LKLFTVNGLIKSSTQPLSAGPKLFKVASVQHAPVLKKAVFKQLLEVIEEITRVINFNQVFARNTAQILSMNCQLKLDTHVILTNYIHLRINIPIIFCGSQVSKLFWVF